MMKLKFYVGLQIQTVCFDNLGLVLAALLNVAIKNNQRFATELSKFLSTLPGYWCIRIPFIFTRIIF